MKTHAEINSQILNLLLAGKRPMEISAALDVTPERVYYHRAKNAGLPPLPRGQPKGTMFGKSKELRESSLKLKRDGRTYAFIGKSLGVSRQRAQQLVRLCLPPSSDEKHCKACGNKSRILHHHHLDYFGGRTETLCVSCHNKRHSSHHAAY